MEFNLFPEIEPYKTGFLKVTNLHNVYYELVGNPQGIPVVFLHGGPGGGIAKSYRRYFDPKYYNVVLFDQRGCGQSTPHAELKENTTWTLVADIETLREHLQLEKWLVFGGSWGSTLALAYAVKHPERITDLVLRGIFLGRPQELKWFYQEGTSRIYPDAWEGYLAPIPPAERGDLMASYYKRLTSEDKAVRVEAAKAWSVWEASTSKLYQDPVAMSDFGEEEFSLAFARIECHYFVNNMFFETDNFLLQNVPRMRHIPCHIVHGRYDVVCPVENAWDLKRAWPEASLHIIQDSGHSLSEKGITSRILQIMSEIKSRKR